MSLPTITITITMIAFVISVVYEAYELTYIEKDK